MDVSFRETESFYSKEGSIISSQGEQSSNEHLLQESDRNEFVELENIIEQFGSSGTNEKSRGRSNDEESQINIELPLLTPLTNESSQNAKSQVLLQPISDESNIFPDISYAQDVPLATAAPRCSQRSNKGVPKKKYEPNHRVNIQYPINNYVSNHRLSKSFALTVNQLSNISIPSNVQEALTDPAWANAVNEEMQALQKNSTWELVSLPEGKKTIRCRWVFTVKLKTDGSIDRYKARLVA